MSEQLTKEGSNLIDPGAVAAAAAVVLSEVTQTADAPKQTNDGNQSTHEEEQDDDDNVDGEDGDDGGDEYGDDEDDNISINGANGSNLTPTQKRKLRRKKAKQREQEALQAAGITPALSGAAASAIGNGSSSSNSSQPAPGIASVSTSSAPIIPPASAVSLTRLPPGTALPTKRKRLPNDTIGILEDEIEENPEDIDKWSPLVRELKAKDKVDSLRNAFERMVVYFPTSSDIWMDYLDLEQSNGEFQKVEQLFARCLPKILNVELWSYYLAYIRRINNINIDGDKARTTISQAYEFVLDRVGFDIDSGPIWNDYIEFIKSREAGTSWEQQQKMDLLRKTYRRAICIPLSGHLERLWQNYSTFETTLNANTARKFTAEVSGTYMNARSSLREMENIFTGMPRTTSPGLRQWSKKEQKIYEKWEQWIDWEKRNPLSTGNKALVDARVTYAYKQAVMTLRYFPEVWYSFSLYTLGRGDLSTVSAASAPGALASSNSSVDAALEILRNGLQANPSSFLLSYKAAELLEKESRYDELKVIYENLIARYKLEREKMVIQNEQFYILLNEAHVYATTQLSLNGKSKKERKAEKHITQKEAEIHSVSRSITLAYTEYMKTAKRSQGIKEARRVFGEARRLPYTTHHIFVASAMMEYHNNKEADIADKIFELGLKRFSENSEYVKVYFDFLILTNDETNARALFEKSISKMPIAAAKPLYEHFMKFTANHGELAALLTLEERFSKMYPDESPMSIFARRFRIPEYDPIEDNDLRPNYNNHSLQQRYQQIQQIESTSILGSSGGDGDDERSDRGDRKRGGRGGGRRNRDEESDDERPMKRIRESTGFSNSSGFSTTSSLEQASTNIIPSGILNLLKALPPPEYLDGSVSFDAMKLTDLIRDTTIPDNLL
ncbi:Rna14p [Sugiyamaella lignohabitans]|uniref:mRNA 3'-end-processing protein RNA14 n=1 Tax=Sugiyamaella lignohabitans TaxID=796027 RepID=A0A167FTY7_9ASCO|nr:Rna14p [Sugiyamaella lignohabitans]ANB15701.1 Rna14p [Sugiyamaella lignohabitans]